MKKINASSAIIATLLIVVAAIYAGNWQASLWAPNGDWGGGGDDYGYCGDGQCSPEEDRIILCPSCMAGTPPEKCRCLKACEQDCSDYGHGNDDCSPMQCADGSEHPRCDAAGNPIDYFADPCDDYHYQECGNGTCDDGEAGKFIEVGGSSGGGGGESWRVPDSQAFYEYQEGSCEDDCKPECPRLECEKPYPQDDVECYLVDKEQFERGCMIACPVYECHYTGGDDQGSYGGYGDHSVCGDGSCDSDENEYSCEEDCGKQCFTVDCAAPPEGCWYENEEYDGNCQVSCGQIKCEEKPNPVCGDGVCHSDEALVVCIDPPFPCEGECRDREYGCFPICKEDCGGGDPYVLPPLDRCATMYCQFGCENGECLSQQFDCNPIVCEDGSGHPSCTPGGHPINYLVNPCFKPSAPEVCYYDDEKYEIGESFKDSDDCNTCFCGEDGNIACTEMYCEDNDDSDGQDDVLCEGQYRPGESYLAADGCNTCTCSENGLSACTRMACPVPGCGLILCGAPDGSMYEVHACDAAGNTVEDPCNTGDSHDDSQSSSQGTEYEDEVVTKPVMNRFSDVTNQTLEGEAANALADRNIIGGFPDGSFRGGQPVNRAEAAKFLLMSRLGVQDGARNNGRFADVLEGEWYVKYVVTAAERGIIDGYKDGTFRPANTVNTAEFLKMLTGAFDLPQNIAYNFSDVPSDAWFARYAGVADAFNLFPGRPDGKLQPERLLTRGEVSIAIYRILNAE